MEKRTPNAARVGAEIFDGDAMVVGTAGFEYFRLQFVVAFFSKQEKKDAFFFRLGIAGFAVDANHSDVYDPQVFHHDLLEPDQTSITFGGEFAMAIRAFGCGAGLPCYFEDLSL